ncbi:phage antirepressor N-terminal domain-containing protein [Bifidobacterium platyrrhinorum]|uniref:Phage antirepressor Ant n=1 Tax=Bifidobacterium platyrrhinorum TaxID=2661628 RepID=A0A6L9SW59_9BIFI|nr:phage antirepressor N-terminal domain-containing protein [Bifidobacterium platyrrhinorum]NEG55431.1 phage antirepressor Ant [Bifidobacterium platyrrhinorum]
MNTIQNIPFHGDTIEAIAQNGTWFASLRRMCENLGVDYSRQLQKLKEKPWAVVDIMPTTGADGKTYQMTMIDRRTTTMWLAGINAGKVREDLRAKIEAYQCEAADALDEYFNEGAAIRLNEGDTEDDIIAKGMLAAGRKIEQLKTQLEQSRAEVEKRGHQLEQAHENLGSLGRQLTEQQPYAAIGAQFVQLDGTISVRDVSRNFQQIDPKMTATRVYEILRKYGYVVKHGCAPTVKGVKPGYLKQKIGKKNNGNMARPYAVFTAKGIGWFITRFIANKQETLDILTIY